MSDRPQVQQDDAMDPSKGNSKHWMITIASMIIFGALGSFLGFRLGKFGAHIDPLAVAAKARFVGFGHKALTIFGGFLGAAGAGYATSQTEHSDEVNKDPQPLEPPPATNKDTPQREIKEAQHQGAVFSPVSQLTK